MQYVRDYYKRADFVWVPNNETISILRDYGYSGDIEVMPNGTDLSVDISEIPILRKEGGVLLNVPDDSFVFVYVGQHIPEKNVDLIIDALNLLNQRGFPLRWFLLEMVDIVGPWSRRSVNLVFLGMWNSVGSFVIENS